MKYAFFIGCTTLSRLQPYEKSARRVSARLGVELLDMPGSSCCGTTYLHTLDHLTALAMAARNIAIAEKMGLDIVTLCNGCTEVLTKANKELKEDEDLRRKVNEVLAEADTEFKGTVEIKHFVKMLKEDVGLDKIKNEMTHSFRDLKVGNHYGCHMLKPYDLYKGEDPENPRVMDDLVALTGAEPIDYPHKLECCAGPIMGVRENVTWSVGLDKVKEVKKQGDVLSTACPFCYLTFERCQLLAENSPNLPIVHIPQLLGLALGLKPDELALDQNKIDSKWLPEKLEES
jgi:heterodisulfide reductase subunit B2